jgi:hypothetical protein
MIANNFTKNVRILCLSCQKLQRNCQILLKRAEASIIPIVLCHIHTILLPYFPHDSLNPAYGEVYSIQHYVIKFVRTVVFSGCSVSSTNKTDRHDITEILFWNGIKHYNINPLKLWCLDLYFILYFSNSKIYYRWYVYFPFDLYMQWSIIKRLAWY